MSLFNAIFLLTVALLVSSTLARHLREDASGSLDVEALRMASPHKQRLMNTLFTQEKALLKARFRLESEANAVHASREEATDDLQAAQRAVDEAREACAVSKSERASGETKARCGSFRMNKKALRAAEERLEVATRAVDDNSVTYKMNTKDLEDVQATISTMKNIYYRPRPSVVPRPIY